jgi:hypothetical protein
MERLHAKHADHEEIRGTGAAQPGGDTTHPGGYRKLRRRQTLRRQGAVNHADSHRLRVGAYCVLTTVDTVIEVSWIEEVKKRDERTY